MTQTIRQGIRVWSVIWVCFIFAFAFLGCAQKTERPIAASGTEAQSDRNSNACYNVSGFVLGDINLNANVYLYQSSSLEFEAVMMTVRTADPIKTGRVNDLAEFNLSCLSNGKYVVSIPSKSYVNNSVGSPLPYEYENSKASLNIVFQGGDNQFLVGAFTIEEQSD